MNKPIDYEAEVKSVYPDAKEETTFMGYKYIVSGEESLSIAYVYAKRAWKDAYVKINVKGRNPKTP